MRSCLNVIGLVISRSGHQGPQRAMPPRKQAKPAAHAAGCKCTKCTPPLLLTQPEPEPEPEPAPAPEPTWRMTAAEERVLRFATLLLVYVLAIAVRLFGSLKLEEELSSAACMAPFFAANTALVAHQLGVEVSGEARTGLLAAAFVAIAPGNVLRSTAGSADSEGVGGFALLFAFLLVVKAVQSGSTLWSSAGALGHFCMAVAWEQSPLSAGEMETNPASWATFLVDLHVVCFLMPVGIYYCVKDATAAKVVLVLYGMLSLCCAGAMLRLMVVLAPAACLLAAVGVSEVLKTYCGQLKPSEALERPDQVSIRGAKLVRNKVPVELPIQREFALMMVAGVSLMLCLYVRHCVWVAAAAPLRTK